jgi:hypothetical protein
VEHRERLVVLGCGGRRFGRLGGPRRLLIRKSAERSGLDAPDPVEQLTGAVALAVAAAKQEREGGLDRGVTQDRALAQ